MIALRVPILIAGMALTGCSLSVTAPMPAYAPLNNLQLAGEVEVSRFTYPIEAKIGPKVINNTAAGTIKINQTVGDVVTNGVLREVRQAGVSTKQGGKCRLAGVVDDLTIDDLGYSATFRSTIHYQLFGPSSATIVDKVYSSGFDGSKGDIVTALVAVNTLIGENVSKLLSDPVFQTALKDSCGGS